MSDLFWKVAATVMASAILAMFGYIAKQIKAGQGYRTESIKIQLTNFIDERISKQIEPISQSVQALQNIDSRIDEKLKPVHVSIQELTTELKEAMNNEEYLRIQLTGSYRFRLIQLCKHHLAQGYMTEDEMDQLSEFFKIYENLGGNGQAKEYYERTKKLPIMTESEE